MCTLRMSPVGKVGKTDVSYHMKTTFDSEIQYKFVTPQLSEGTRIQWLARAM